MTYGRSTVALLAALALGLLGLGLPSAPAEAAPVWSLRWSPDPAVQGLGAFETVEDDRADSHTGAAPHIKVTSGAYRFDMHMVDRDTSTDRQRHEVTGNRTSSSSHLQWRLGETWRVTYSMYIPGSLMATTSFTHIMQTKQPGTGTSPITVTSLRRVGGVQTIEHKVIAGDVLVGRTNLEPLQNKWIDIEYEIKIGDGTAGAVRWVVKSAGTTVVDATKTGVDTFLADRVRPKWGIYRSLGDTSGSLRDTYLLLRDMRAYQQTGTAPGGDTQAPTVPGGLRATGVTSGSVSLAWNAATDDAGVTGYEVYRGTALVGTATGTAYTDTGLAAATPYSYTVRAKDAAGNRSAASAPLSVTTASAPGTETLLSQGRPATASSVEASGYEPDKAVDGQSATRWASAEGIDPQWLRVDLGTTAALSRVRLDWEAAHASAYRIQSSADGATWTDLATVTGGDGGTDELTVSGDARYVRMYGTRRGTPYGYSLHEFKVYGTTGTPAPTLTPSPSPSGSWQAGVAYSWGPRPTQGRSPLTGSWPR